MIGNLRMAILFILLITTFCLIVRLAMKGGVKRGDAIKAYCTGCSAIVSMRIYSIKRSGTNADGSTCFAAKAKCEGFGHKNGENVPVWINLYEEGEIK